MLAARLLRGYAGSAPPQLTLADILAHLADGFVKYASNPILPRGGGGAWDSWGVRELEPVVNESGAVVTESDGIWGYYGGSTSAANNKIGLAKSTDNGVTWTRYTGNPVVSATGTGWYAAVSDFIGQPSTVKTLTGTRAMLAAGRDTSGNDSIGCLTSTDGLTWTDAGQKLTLASFTDGGTAIVELGVPCLFRRTSDWAMLCEARTSGVSGGWRIYGATAPTPTGTWTPLNSGHPVLAQNGAPFTWEAWGVANPHVIITDDGYYVVLYNGVATSSSYWQVGFAYSTDLLTWTRYASNPVLTIGAGGAWDNENVESCFLWREPGASALRIFYQGYTTVDSSMQVGLATAT